MGMNYIPAGLYVKEAHRRDIKFNRFILREESGSEAQTVKAGEQVRVQLQSASGPDAAYTIIRDTLALHFKPLLRMTEEQKLDETVGLVDQSVDSRVAVDIRAWFLKELDVDVPTLKIMGGASISDLVKSAVENMPQSSEGDGVESPVKPVGKEMSSPFPAKPEELLLRPRSERAPTTSTPLSSGSPIFMPARVTTPTFLSTLAAHLRRGIISTRVPRHRRNQWSSMGWSREFRKEMLGDPDSYHFHLMCENSGFLTTVPCSPDKGYGVKQK